MGRRRTTVPFQRAMGLALLAGLVAAGVPAQGLVQWTDIAPEAGIRFQTAGETHPEGDGQWPAFPEIMGGGACWADFDGDGYDDLYLVNQVHNAENPSVDAAWARAADPHSQLYHNNHGDGTFTDIGAEAGVEARGWGYGCSAADYDGDGYVDLFVANFGDNLLFHNDGDGTFTNATASSGVAMTGACGEFLCMSASSAWADHDHDGDLDLYVTNYVDTNTTDYRRGPLGHQGQENFLHRNNGDGTFTEVAEQAGVAGNPTDVEGSKSLGVVWFDADLDGDLDLYVMNDEVPADFYVNEGDGTFTERSEEANLDNRLANMGITSGDYDNDGLPDLYFTHYAAEKDGFYRNNGDGTFEDRSGEDDLLHSQAYVGWSTAFVDLDRDMDLDIMEVNGHTEPEEPDYRSTAMAFRNDPPRPGAPPSDRHWTDITHLVGDGISHPRVGRGAAWADFDLDGDTDIAVVPNGNESAALLRASGPIGGNWLTLRLRQPGANAFGIGARVLLEAGGITQVREVHAGSGYLSQGTLDLEFGLGPHPMAERVTVQWPGGGTTTVSDILASQVVRIDRSLGVAINDTLTPATRMTVDGTRGFAGWWLSPVEATLTGEDLGVSWVSGVDHIDARNDGGAWAPYVAPLDLGEGRHVVRARATDAAGNVEPVRTFRVDVDTTPPALSHHLDGAPGEHGWWVSDAVSVAMDASDAGSGVHKLQYRVDGADWLVYLAPFELRDEGVHVVEFFGDDAAGNVAPAQAFEVKLDRTPPQVALVRPAEGMVYLGDGEPMGVGTGPATIVAAPPAVGMGDAVFTLRAAASDATSGVAGVTFLVDWEHIAEDREAPYTAPWAVGEAYTSLYIVAAEARDEAGNVAKHEVNVLLADAVGAAGLVAP